MFIRVHRWFIFFTFLSSLRSFAAIQLVLACLLIVWLAPRLFAAESPEPPPPPDQKSESKTETWSVHFQATVISQGHGEFDSPYSGQNSLASREEIRTSFTSTLFLGRRLWPGGEVYVNPEVAGGRGIGGVVGIAGFPNGDIARVGDVAPTVSLARLFLRQTIGFGGDEEEVEPDENQLVGLEAESRLTLTLGKLSASDLFDDNAYSHDPRTQFMNWSLMENGAWDYPADTRGYTYGGAIELNQPDWALRYGLFAVPKEANGLRLDRNYAQAQGPPPEWEGRYSIAKRSGKVRLLGYWNRAHMGNYRKTLDTPAFNLDIAKSRAYSSKYGFGLDVEQDLSPDLGLFLRLGWNDGHTETWSFTEIDQTASLGLSWRGTVWSRPDDLVGLACAANGLSKDHKDYLAAGGYGFLVGDGRLNYSPEEVFEAFYLCKMTTWLWATVDYQFVNHPAYNADRGPVHVWAIRGHVEF